MEGGPPIFGQDCTCPALLVDQGRGFPYGALTRCGPPFQTLPVPTTLTAGLFRVRSPLLTESRGRLAPPRLMSVPPATEMFQFAGFASRPYRIRRGIPQGVAPFEWVAPFGDPGITDRSHLPRAFRSVPRPSSPLSAKASTRCPFLALPQTAAHSGQPRTRGPQTSPRAGAHEDTRDPRRHRRPGSRLGHSTPSSPRQSTPSAARPPGGGDRVRTGDLLLAKQALCRLSYTPARLFAALVGQGGFEPPTSRLSSARSNRLSY